MASSSRGTANRGYFIHIINFIGTAWILSAWRIPYVIDIIEIGRYKNALFKYGFSLEFFWLSKLERLVFWFFGSLLALWSLWLLVFLWKVLSPRLRFLLSLQRFYYLLQNLLSTNLPKQKIQQKRMLFPLKEKLEKSFKKSTQSKVLGQIKIGGEVWSAKSSDDTIISQDTEVRIEKIDGVKVIVKPV